MFFNYRTLSLLKIFFKIFIQSKDITQSLQLVDYKKGCFSLFFLCFSESINDELCAISFNWINIFEKFFHSDNVLWLKNVSCENGIYRAILPRVDFFLFHFSSSFSIFFENFLFDNIPLTIIFSTSTKSLYNSESVKSFKHLKFYCQLIWNEL